MGNLLREVELRNLYRIYDDGDSYAVVNEDRRGRRYEYEVSQEAVTYLQDRLRGQRVDAAGAARVLGPKAESLKLPCTYGDKLRYSAQHVLLVLVALGKATVVKESRSYIYSIR